MVSKYFGFMFPLRCLVCGSCIEEDENDNLNFICQSCKLSIVERGDNYCPVCGKIYEGITGESRCSECIKDEKPFDRLLYHFLYGGAIGDAISTFKYGHNLMVGRGLVLESFSHLKKEFESKNFDLILPTPQHILKYFIRGFSQSAYISSILSDLTGLPVRYDVLKKKRYTKPQVGLSREERLINLKGSFDIRSAHVIEDKRILLIDDVYTTGATTFILSELLIRSGARSVTIFVLARSA